MLVHRTSSSPLNWKEFGRNSPITREFIENVLIHKYHESRHRTYIVPICVNPRTTVLPMIPKPSLKSRIWQGRRGRRIISSTCGHGTSGYTLLNIVEGNGRRSHLLFRRHEGMILCVEYQDQYIVILVSHYLHIYTNHGHYFLSSDLRSNTVPSEIDSMSPQGRLKYIHLECERYCKLIGCWIQRRDDSCIATTA